MLVILFSMLALTELSWQKGVLYAQFKLCPQFLFCPPLTQTQTLVGKKGFHSKLSCVTLLSEGEFYRINYPIVIPSM
jgi:hypothetical protein